MQLPDVWNTLITLCKPEMRHMAKVNSSDRLWQMPFAAALSSGLPLLVGAHFNHLEFGLVSSLGGMVFLYLPSTPLHHRMVTIMACAFAMSACYAFGVLAHFLAGFTGAICIHSPRFREIVGRPLRRLVPTRFLH